MSHEWPALLVGGPSSGKSTCLHELARVCNRRLSEISLTSSTDSTELLGSFEQHDPLRKIRKCVDSLVVAVKSATRSFACSHKGSNATQAAQLLRALQIYKENMDSSLDLAALSPLATSFPDRDVTNLFASLKVMVKNSDMRNVKMFEWVDGILLRSLERVIGWYCTIPIYAIPQFLIDLIPFLNQAASFSLTKMA